MYALETTTFGGRGTTLDLLLSDFYHWGVAAGDSSETFHVLHSV